MDSYIGVKQNFGGSSGFQSFFRIFIGSRALIWKSDTYGLTSNCQIAKKVMLPIEYEPKDLQTKIT